jgi:ERCC4-related helicase
MAIAMELDGAIATPAALIDVQPLALRSYQAEMVEESLSQNVVVVMDTGSGKTYMYVQACQSNHAG